jgi:hypothetical protein
VKLNMDTGEWAWNVRDPDHNHAPFDYAISAPSLCKKSREAIQLDITQRIAFLSRSGVEPRKIIISLHDSYKRALNKAARSQRRRAESCRGGSVHDIQVDVDRTGRSDG